MGVTRFLPRLAVFAFVAGLYGFGLLDFIELKLLDARFRLLPRDASQELVVVGIDVASLRELRVWPWPRGYHAALVERLVAAGARRIALDIDFSSDSTPKEDRALARSLAAAGGRVVLPVFKQLVPDDEGGHEVVEAVPLAMFARGAALASINVRPDADGLIRRVSLFERWGETDVPSLFALLAGADGRPYSTFYVDYGIRPDSIPRLSYVDVLRGRFDPAAVAGKTVIVGAMAVELGDQLAVPNYRVIPGPILQALAFESIVQGRAVQRFARAPILAVTLVLVLVLGRRFGGCPWRRGLVLLGASVAVMAVFATGAQAAFPISIDTTPWVIASALSYAVALIGRINQQDLRLLAQGLAMRRKDAFMRMVVENSFDAIVTVDQDGLIRSVNRAGERMFGVTADDIVGRDLGVLTPDRATTGDEPDPARLLRARGGPYELVGRRKNGGVFPFEAVVSEMRLQDERISIALLRDVSAEKLAEAQAKEARRRLGEAIERISDGFALYDADDRLVLCNSKFREFVGEAADLARPGWRYRDIMRVVAAVGRVSAAEGRADDWLEERLAAHRDPGDAYEEQLTDGTVLRVSERRTDEGGVVAVYADITELKQREVSLRAARKEAEAADQAKTEFLHAMGHELRTPLNGIIGFSELLAAGVSGELTDKQRSYVDDIHESGRRLLAIINDILDIAQIETGEIELREDRFDFARVVEAAVGLVGVRAARADIDIRTVLRPDLPPLRADERRIKQVLVNLLANAVKYSDAGSTVTISADLDEHGRGVVAIADSGIGMTPEDVTKALTPFAQVDGQLSRKYEGAGLGLPLAKSLVELHGGALEVESAPGVGTTVTVRLPPERLSG